MNLGLTGKLAVITGASRGIGHAVAEDLAEEGCRLILAATNAALLEELAEDLQGRLGTEARVFAADPSARASQDDWWSWPGPRSISWSTMPVPFPAAASPRSTRRPGARGGT